MQNKNGTLKLLKKGKSKMMYLEPKSTAQQSSSSKYINSKN